MRRAAARFVLIALNSLLLAAVAAAQIAVPPLKARVTDLTGTLTAEQKVTLEQRLAAFEARKGSQVAVLMLQTTKPEEIEQFSIRVAEAWKIGRKGTNDGLILLVAKNDRRLRIEVGYGLEGAIPDATAKRIISESITPRFKVGDFYGGISAGLDQLIRLVDGERLPPSARAAPQSTPVGAASQSASEASHSYRDEFPISLQLWLLVMAIVLPIFALNALRRRVGRALAAFLFSVTYGLAAGVLFGELFAFFIVGLIVFFVTIVEINDKPLGGRFFSSGSSGGGGSAGWGGGGGSFGGGGASGSW